MPSPYGPNRGAASYYQHGGMPMNYVYNWDGVAQGSRRAAETVALSGYTEYPVSMSLMSGTKSVLHSGPEQGKMIDGLGIFGFSDAMSYLLIGAAALAGWYLLKGRKR